MIKELSKSMYKEMKNPYFSAYFLLLDNWRSFFEKYDNSLDPYDYFTLILRFLPVINDKRKQIIDQFI